MHPCLRPLLVVPLSLALWLSGNALASAQYGANYSYGAVYGGGPAPITSVATVAPGSAAISAGQYYHYPYYYFPHSYWPTTGPRWPERPGDPYMKPPAYMAYPPFHEPHWRYELWQPRSHYRGFHFWLDQF